MNLNFFVVSLLFLIVMESSFAARAQNYSTTVTQAAVDGPVPLEKTDQPSTPIPTSAPLVAVNASVVNALPLHMYSVVVVRITNALLSLSALMFFPSGALQATRIVSSLELGLLCSALRARETEILASSRRTSRLVDSNSNETIAGSDQTVTFFEFQSLFFFHGISFGPGDAESYSRGWILFCVCVAIGVWCIFSFTASIVGAACLPPLNPELSHDAVFATNRQRGMAKLLFPGSLYLLVSLIGASANIAAVGLLVFRTSTLIGGVWFWVDITFIAAVFIVFDILPLGWFIKIIFCDVHTFSRLYWKHNKLTRPKCEKWCGRLWTSGKWSAQSVFAHCVYRQYYFIMARYTGRGKGFFAIEYLMTVASTILIAGFASQIKACDLSQWLQASFFWLEFLVFCAFRPFAKLSQNLLFLFTLGLTGTGATMTAASVVTELDSLSFLSLSGLAPILHLSALGLVAVQVFATAMDFLLSWVGRTNPDKDGKEEIETHSDENSLDDELLSRAPAHLSRPLLLVDTHQEKENDLMGAAKPEGEERRGLLRITPGWNDVPIVEWQVPAAHDPSASSPYHPSATSQQYRAVTIVETPKTSEEKENERREREWHLAPEPLRKWLLSIPGDDTFSKKHHSEEDAASDPSGETRADSKMDAPEPLLLPTHPLRFPKAAR